MAGICEAGHRSETDDYCDVCGLPIVAPAPPMAPAGRPSPPGGRTAAPRPPAPTSQRCPNCSAINPADALFCEACGYDYTTGTLPRTNLAGALGLRPRTQEVPVSQPDQTPDADLTTQAPADSEDVSAQDPESPGAESASQPDPSAPAGDAPEASAVTGDAPTPETPVSEAETRVPAPAENPLDDAPTAGRPAPRRESYVAEVWIDPDWYAVQQSPDQMPSVGLPETFKLGADNLVGRISRSRNIYPEVDCGLDTGCSRRQARLSTDGTRWYVEDLESANGTYVAPSSGPLPTTPITGRRELGADDRVYVGAWTRIVVRKASKDEIDSLG